MARTTGKTIRVLIADDEPALRTLLEVELGIARGVRLIASAADGVEAVEQARELRPDVVIMDIRMPRMSGIEATEIISRELPEIKIVVLTNSPDDDHERQAMDAGAALYLEKLTFVNQIGDIVRDLHRTRLRAAAAR